VRLLLDTNAFLWFLLDDPKLRVTARSLIADPNNEIGVSPATYWEIAIKIALREYALPEPFEVSMDREITINDFHILHSELKHIAILTTMPFHHRDPFDRLLIAQATIEQIPIVSNDTAFDPYPVTRLW
jgi:PIN domain nuclease of toxin-antitoxin system